MRLVKKTSRAYRSVPHQPLVGASDVLHLFVGAALHDLAALHDDDLVGITDGAQAVRDDDARAAATAQAFIDMLLGGRIQGAGGLVEDQDGRLPDQRPGDLETLALSSLQS